MLRLQCRVRNAAFAMPRPQCHVRNAVSAMPCPPCRVRNVLSNMPRLQCPVQHAMSAMPCPTCCVCNAPSNMPHCSTALFGSLLGVPSTVFHVWSQTLLLVSHAGQARQQSLATRTRVIRVYMLMRGLQGLCVLMAGCGWIAAPSALLSSIRPWGLLLSINIEETNMAAYSVPFAQQASLSATDAVVCSLYFAFMPGLTWRQVASWSSLMVGSLGLQVALTRWWCMRRSSAWRGDKAKQEEFASKAKHE